jgi:hypothetical protein
MGREIESRQGIHRVVYGLINENVENGASLVTFIDLACAMVSRNGISFRATIHIGRIFAYIHIGQWFTSDSGVHFLLLFVMEKTRVKF